MHCGSCALLVDDVLTDVDGVASTETSMRRGRTVVRIDPDRCKPEALVSAVAELGYTATLAD